LDFDSVSSTVNQGEEGGAAAVEDRDELGRVLAEDARLRWMKAWEPTDRTASTAASCLCRYFILRLEKEEAEEKRGGKKKKKIRGREKKGEGKQLFALNGSNYEFNMDYL
jgi:hypothetical protein